MATITSTDRVFALGMLLRFTLDPAQESTLEDIQERDLLLVNSDMTSIENAARIGGVNIETVQLLAVKVKKQTLEIVDTPEHPHPVDEEFINARLADAAEWNERHPAEEPASEEWGLLAAEAVEFLPVDLVEMEIAEAVHED